MVESCFLRRKIERRFHFSKVGFRLEAWQPERGARIARRLHLVLPTATASYQLSQATDKQSAEVTRRLGLATL